MLSHTLSAHAETRMRQRGLRDADLDLVLDCATQVAPDAYMLTRADTQREINRRRHEIQCLERLSGCKVVVEGPTVVTCYHAHRQEQRRTLRKGRMAR